MLVLCDAACSACERSRRSRSLLLPRMPRAADCRSDKKQHLATASTAAVIDRHTGWEAATSDTIGIVVCFTNGGRRGRDDLEGMRSEGA